MARILVLGNNASMPTDAAQQAGQRVSHPWRRCRSCGGDGYTYDAPIDPSERPMRVTCDCCKGEGFFRGN